MKSTLPWHVVLEDLEYSGTSLIKDIRLSETIKPQVLAILEEYKFITNQSGLISITEMGLVFFSLFSRYKKS
jgi:hypothetical protein